MEGEIPLDLVDGDGEVWWRQLPHGARYREIRWRDEISDNCQTLDEVVSGAATGWETLARKLTRGAHSTDRAFYQSHIDRFAEEKDQASRCRRMLTRWLGMSMNHNVGALYKGLHASGLGTLADRVLSTKLGTAEGATGSEDSAGLTGGSVVEECGGRNSDPPSYDESQEFSLGQSAISMPTADTHEPGKAQHGGCHDVNVVMPTSRPLSEGEVKDAQAARQTSMDRMSSLNSADAPTNTSRHSTG